MEATSIDLRTPFQKHREEKHRQICEAYKTLKQQHPEASTHRLCLVLGENFMMTATGIRKIIIEHGLFTPNQRPQQ